MGSLSGKTALVTGSTSGIGLAIATAMAAEGAAIMLNGLGDADQIEKIRSDMAKTYGVEVLFDGANLLKPDEIEGLIKTIADKLGGPDIIVNNAGHPARRADRGIPAGAVGRHHRPEPDLVPSTPCATPSPP